MSEGEKELAMTHIVQVRMVSDAAVADKDRCDCDNDDVNQIRVRSEHRRDDAGTALDHERSDAKIAERSEDSREMQQIVSDRHRENLGAGGLEGDAARGTERIGEAGLGHKDVGPSAVSSAIVGKQLTAGL